MREAAAKIESDLAGRSAGCGPECGPGLVIVAKKFRKVAPLPGYVSNYVPCSGASVSKRFGGNQGLGLSCGCRSVGNEERGGGTFHPSDNCATCEIMRNPPRKTAG